MQRPLRGPSLIFQPAAGVDEGARLDQQALALVPLARPAEAHDDSMSLAPSPCPPRQQSIAGRKELQVVQTGAAKANRARRLHDEKVAGARAAAAGPVAVQGRYHDKFRRRARLPYQTLSLPLGKLSRHPMGPARQVDVSIPARAETKRLPTRCAGDVVRLARLEGLGGCPRSQEPHGFGQRLAIFGCMIFFGWEGGILPTCCQKKQRPGIGLMR
jgi:hypothetical protein